LNHDFQDEQRDRNGNDAVAEGFDTSSLLLIVAPRVFHYLFQAIERLAASAAIWKSSGASPTP
jgi:hypothetical protein